MKKLLLALALLLFALPAAAETGKESTYDRVIRTGTLRCGYILLPPEMNKDPNSGSFSGISYDVAMELGRRLNLKVEWTEEVNFMTAIPGLKAGRFDAVCFSLYRMATMAREADFTTPLFYSSTGAFVRANDARFDGNLPAINDDKVTVATIDSEMSQFIAAEDYPKAKTLSMPQSTDLSQMLLAVESGKADVAFSNGLVASGYLKANPGKLRNIAADHPIRTFSHGFMFAKGQNDFGKMLDVTLAEMHDHGVIQKILSKTDPEGKSYLRVAKPYQPSP